MNYLRNFRGRAMLMPWQVTFEKYSISWNLRREDVRDFKQANLEIREIRERKKKRKTRASRDARDS